MLIKIIIFQIEFKYVPGNNNYLISVWKNDLKIVCSDFKVGGTCVYIHIYTSKTSNLNDLVFQ